MIKKSTDKRLRPSIALKQALLSRRFSSNKPDIDLVAAFFKNQSGATSRGAEYYILGNGDGRVLMHKTHPLAQIIGGTVYVNLHNPEGSDTAVGINKFLSDKNARDKFQIRNADPISFIYSLGSLMPDAVEKLKAAILKFGESGWSRKLQEHLAQSQDTFQSDDEMFNAFKTASILIHANALDTRREIEKLLLEGTTTPEEVIQAFSRIPDISINNQEANLLEKLNTVNSPVVNGIYDFLFQFSTQTVRSYYDISNFITFGKNVDLSQVDIKTDYTTNIAPQLTGNEPAIFKSYLKKLSDAYNRLKNDDVLQEAYKRVNEPDFFTTLSTLNNKDLFEAASKKKNQQGILKNENPEAMKNLLSQLNAWTAQLFTDIKFKALGRMREDINRLTEENEKRQQAGGEKKRVKPQSFGYYASSALNDQYKAFNDAMRPAIESVLSDPEVQQIVAETAMTSENLLATLVKTGGEAKESVNFNPKQPFMGLLKEFLVAAFKFRGFSLGSGNVDQASGLFKETSGDIFKYQAFVNSVVNEDLSKKLRSGFIWSGVFVEEYVGGAAHAGQAIEIPLGTIAYGAGGGEKDKEFGRKTILGNGQILRIEFEDNFIRLSVHSYHATLNGQQPQEEVKRMLELKNEMYRMSSDISKVLTATNVSDKILSKTVNPNDAEKEMKKLVRDREAPVNSVISPSGGTISVDAHGTVNYFKVEDIRSRGFNYYQLVEFYGQLRAGNVKEKFMNTLFESEIKACIDGFDRYIDACISNGQEELQNMKDSGISDLRESAWLEDQEFYRNNIVAVIQYAVGDQFQYGTHAFYPLFGKNISADGKVIKAERAFIQRRSVNPGMVNVSLIDGVNNLGNEVLTHAQQVAPVYKKILAEFNKLIEGSKMQFNLEESSPTFLPMMHQGPIVTDIKTIIEDSRKRYVNPVGRTYTIPIADVLKGDLGQKYGDYFDANYHIQYHNDLDTLINLIERVYNANLKLADLMNLAKDTFTIGDESKQVEVTFIQQFEKTLSSKLGATLITQVKSQLSNGLVSVKEIVSSTERFMSSVEGVSSPEQILEKVPLDQIKDKYTTTVTDVLQAIYEETLQILDSAADPANVSGGTRETNVELDKLKKKIQEFEILRRELRQSTKQLMALLGKYSSEKGMLLDMIKSGRALNYLLSGAEVGKRSEGRKEKATEGEDGEEQ